MHMERLVKTFSFRVLSSNESSADKQRNATDNLIKEISTDAIKSHGY